MAAPEMQNAPIAGESRQPPASPETAAPAAAHAVAGSNDWREFDRLERIFHILLIVAIVIASAAYIGHRLDNDAVFGVAILVLIVALVGLAGLVCPTLWFYIKGHRRSRRRRAAERGWHEGSHQDA